MSGSDRNERMSLEHLSKLHTENIWRGGAFCVLFHLTLFISSLSLISNIDNGTLVSCWGSIYTAWVFNGLGILIVAFGFYISNRSVEESIKATEQGEEITSQRSVPLLDGISLALVVGVMVCWAVFLFGVDFDKIGSAESTQLHAPVVCVSDCPEEKLPPPPSNKK